jgi:mycothiol synthase
MVTRPLLRPVGLDDAGWVSEVLTRCRPDEPTDPEVLRHQWATSQLAWTRERWAVTVGEDAVGFAAATHPPWQLEPERAGRWNLSLIPEVSGLADEVVVQVEARLRAEGARSLWTGAYEDEGWLASALGQRGYRRDQMERQWELDLVANHDRLLAVAASSRARMAEQGVRMLTLDRMLDQPGIWARLTAFYAEAEEDIPRTTPFHPMTEEEVRADMTAPNVPPDRVWLALAGAELAGLSHLTYPPLRGNSWTAFTGTARAFRGRGIARAVKMESLVQALELGVRRVRTGNDERNAPMLHINDLLGYLRIPGWVAYRKALDAA